MKDIIRYNLPNIINWAGAITVLILLGVWLQKCDSQLENNNRIKSQFYIDNGYVWCIPIGKDHMNWVKPEHCAIPIK